MISQRYNGQFHQDDIEWIFHAVLMLCFTAKAVITPPLKEHLGELLSSDITLETDGFVG